MTIIEVIIAFAILMVVLVPIALLLGNTIGQAASARERLTALSIAEQYVELLNNTPLDGTRNETAHDTTLPIVDKTLQQTTSALVRSTVAYTVFARFTWALHQSTTLDLCTSGAAPTLLRLRVTVKWPRGETQQITDTTLINYPPSGILTDGFLAIKVDGSPASGPPADATGHAWSTRVQAVPVTITPEATVTDYSTSTSYPNQYGCVFQEVPPGKYEVSVADPSHGTPAGTDYGTPHWVANYDEELSETEPSPSSVTVGGVTTVSFQYDEGSFIDLTYPTTTVAESDVTCPDAGSILCMTTGQSPSSSTAPASTPRADIAVLTASGWTVHQPTAARLIATTCAGSTRCISVGYRKTGSGDAGASVSTPTGTGNVQFSSDSVPAGVLALEGITCPTAQKCYAYGEGASTSNATVLTATVGTGTLSWSLLNTGLASVAQIKNLTCTAAATCYADGTSTSQKAVVLSLTGSSWKTNVLPTSPKTVKSVSDLVCGPSACYVAASSSGGSALILSPKSGDANTWIEDSTIPSTTTTLVSLECSSSTCYAAGGSSSAAAILSVKSTTATTVTWQADSLPSGLTSLSSMTCAATKCYAVGSTSKGPEIISLSSTSATSWSKGSPSVTMDSISSLSCASASVCAATGTTTASGRITAVVLSHTTTTSSKWNEDALPAGVAPVYLVGAACTSAGSVCAAPGATDEGAVFLSSTGAAWTNGTPSGLTGMYLSDTPIAVYNAELSPASSLQVASPTPISGDVSSIGPLFPFASGYEVAAAGCASQMTDTAATVSSVPGGTSTTSLPMGLLPIEVKSATGTFVSGASVTAKLTCTRLTAPSGQTRQTTFSFESTDPMGLSDTAVMYGSYKLTVTSGSTPPVTVTVTVTETGTKVSGVTTPLPTPVVINL